MATPSSATRADRRLSSRPLSPAAQKKILLESSRFVTTTRKAFARRSGSNKRTDRDHDPERSRPALVVRFCRVTAGLPGQDPSLIKRGLEIGVAVAKRHATLANRHAAIGFAFGTAIDGNEPIGWPFDLDHPVYEHLAAAVHGDKVRRSIALAGDDDDAAALQRDIGNQGISDHDGRDAGGGRDALRLFDIPRDGV